MNIKNKIIYLYIILVISPLKLIGYVLKNKSIDVVVLDLIKKRFPDNAKVNGLFFDTSNPLIFDRGTRLHTKEPDTINWIDEYINDGDVLYDIGANIGVYSLYAAKYKNAITYSFEPESANYYYLNKNIYHNNLSNKIKAYNIALNDSNLLSVLNLSQFRPGAGDHNFNKELDANHKKFNSAFKQGMIGLSVDDFIYEWGGETPNHIKIDVDGNEHIVINGMTNILKDMKLKTIAIEVNLNLESDDELKNKLISYGFKLLTDERYINNEYLSNGYLNLFFVR
jgi:FkbM family methyltransferase